MGGSFSFETLKLRKRTSTWALGGLLIAAVGPLGYLLVYWLVTETGGDPSETERYLTSFYPENLVPGVLGTLTGVGGVVSLILGSSVAGDEHGWDTLKTLLTQRPGRGRVFAGKLLALAAVLAIFVVACFAAGVAGSYVVARLEDAPVAWPPASELLLGMGAAWLVLAAWTSVGAFLATLLRGTALAVGLGLAYALVLENLVSGLSLVSETAEKVRPALLGKNSSDLARSFEDAPVTAAGAGVVEPVQAALVLAAYVIVALTLVLFLLRHRDVV